MAAISAAIQEDSDCMDRGVTPQIGLCGGSTVVCLNVPNDVSRLDCQDVRSF